LTTSSYRSFLLFNRPCTYPSGPISASAISTSGVARHYGLSVEELDFIINYDIKYRVGGEADEEVDE